MALEQTNELSEVKLVKQNELDKRRGKNWFDYLTLSSASLNVKSSHYNDLVEIAMTRFYDDGIVVSPADKGIFIQFTNCKGHRLGIFDSFQIGNYITGYKRFLNRGDGYWLFTWFESSTSEIKVGKTNNYFLTWDYATDADVAGIDPTVDIWEAYNGINLIDQVPSNNFINRFPYNDLYPTDLSPESLYLEKIKDEDGKTIAQFTFNHPSQTAFTVSDRIKDRNYFPQMVPTDTYKASMDEIYLEKYKDWQFYTSFVDKKNMLNVFLYKKSLNPYKIGKSFDIAMYRDDVGKIIHLKGKDINSLKKTNELGNLSKAKYIGLTSLGEIEVIFFNDYLSSVYDRDKIATNKKLDPQLTMTHLLFTDGELSSISFHKSYDKNLQPEIWDGTADDSWYNTEDDVFEIRNPRQLAALDSIIVGVQNGNFSNFIWSDGTKDKWDVSSQEFIDIRTERYSQGIHIVYATIDYLIKPDDFSGKTIKLVNDIYLNEVWNFDNWSTEPPLNKWDAIGRGNSFKGILDGQGYNIIGMYQETYVQLPHSACGLFYTIGDGAIIRNLGIHKGFGYTHFTNGGLLSSSIDYEANVFVDNCFVDGSIILDLSLGLEGYSTNVGGMVGEFNNSRISLSNCYSATKITKIGTPNANIGGFVGYTGTLNNWSTNRCFYDTEVSGQSDDKGWVYPRTTAQMKDPTTYSGRWDLINTWNIRPDKNDGYPYLVHKNDTYLWYRNMENILNVRNCPSFETLFRNGIFNFGSTEITVKGLFKTENSTLIFVSLDLYNISWAIEVDDYDMTMRDRFDIKLTNKDSGDGNVGILYQTENNIYYQNNEKVSLDYCLFYSWSSSNQSMSFIVIDKKGNVIDRKDISNFTLPIPLMHISNFNQYFSDNANIIMSSLTSQRQYLSFSVTDIPFLFNDCLDKNQNFYPNTTYYGDPHGPTSFYSFNTQKISSVMEKNGYTSKLVIPSKEIYSQRYLINDTNMDRLMEYRKQLPYEKDYISTNEKNIFDEKRYITYDEKKGRAAYDRFISETAILQNSNGKVYELFKVTDTLIGMEAPYTHRWRIEVKFPLYSDTNNKLKEIYKGKDYILYGDSNTFTEVSEWIMKNDPGSVDSLAYFVINQ